MYNSMPKVCVFSAAAYMSSLTRIGLLYSEGSVPASVRQELIASIRQYLESQIDK